MSSDGSNSAAMLRGFVDDLLRLEEAKADIAGDITDLKKRAKETGFDPKAIARIVREMRESESARRARRETEELAEIYRASLGMLDGTPLGDEARRRMTEEQPPEGEPEQAPDEAQAVPATLGPAEIEAARDAGHKAAHEGVSILANPFVAGDPRRAAWDEGWCAATGSDGMEIPKAWRRTKPPKGKAGDDKGSDEGKPEGGAE
ncbi:DUF2312 domain-containing protein [Kaistia geumhonensis]|uniref:Uncharacterized protein (UPF0335 family) n=1 Tax=Kaistia geumhonensis TaxID=410839 RepID=A0ABU0M5Q4_9HYPH|nr:GapR family DNA-binding domain-containing protein [Kaistia geumhonensis]MCX5478483.1 DUF2312 domain-containing protein [Kaistia geumhonensis]MDQ0516299.1 uncharacterized protein (UPF0335 family) [Kaistia geumhonensis]